MIASKKKIKQHLLVIPLKQWFGFSTSTARAWVQSLVGELRPHRLHGTAKKNCSPHIFINTKCWKVFVCLFFSF